jgi:CTD kinase subunit alpha
VLIPFSRIVPEDAIELAHWVFSYDPKKRPTAKEVLEHRYFSLDPKPERAITIRELKGDWHEYESKGRRKREQREQREREKAAAEGAPYVSSQP